MKPLQHCLSRITNIGFILMMGVSMSTYADNWKEEALLHDGSKIIVSRTQDWGGRHELGQSPPIKEQAISFILPNTKKQITFKNDFGEDIGRANFLLLALHVLNDTPYIVTEPNLCLSYNKWGRPNPPYVVFKHDANKWQRISLEELPAEFKDINLVVSTKTITRKLNGNSIVSAELVRKFNSDLTQPELKTILREPLANGGKECLEEVYNGKGTWLSIDWFSNKPTQGDCLKVCEREGFDPQHCPCNRLFNKE